jgi:hypothetical protein
MNSKNTRLLAAKNDEKTNAEEHGKEPPACEVFSATDILVWHLTRGMDGVPPFAGEWREVFLQTPARAPIVTVAARIASLTRARALEAGMADASFARRTPSKFALITLIALIRIPQSVLSALRSPLSGFAKIGLIGLIALIRQCPSFPSGLISFTRIDPDSTPSHFTGPSNPSHPSFAHPPPNPLFCVPCHSTGSGP